MHCVDCHFVQDVHGNTKLHGEVRAAIEIQCIDCHGTADKTANLLTIGPGRRTPRRQDGAGRDLAALRTPFGQAPLRAQRRQALPELDGRAEPARGRSSRRPTRSTPRSEHYNEKSHLAKTVRFDADGQMVWGDIPGGDEDACAHANQKMSCIACHSSWNPSCFGCHLPQQANKKMPAPAQRGRRHAQLRLLQLPDAARRRLHAGPRRRRDRQPDRPGPLVVRRSTSARTTTTASRSTCSSRRSRPRA